MKKAFALQKSYVSYKSRVVLKKKELNSFHVGPWQGMRKQEVNIKCLPFFNLFLKYSVVRSWGIIDGMTGAPMTHEEVRGL